MQKPIGVEIPSTSDSLVLGYQRLRNTINSKAPNQEIQKGRDALWQTVNELRAAFEKQFAMEDENQIEQLLWERADVVSEVKQLLRRIEEVQQANGLRSASQSRLAAKVQDAVERLNEHTPINRTVATLEEIEKDEAEQNRLCQMVEDAKGERQQNAWSLEVGIRNAQELYRQNRNLAAREESISKRIAQLRLPVEQRNQSRSSIVWQVGSDVFQAMCPTA